MVTRGDKSEPAPKRVGRRGRSRYLGVYPREGSRYQAGFTSKGFVHFLGLWSTEKAAAIARDRAVLHFGAQLPLNFPLLSTKLGPLSPKELSRAAQLERKSSSEYTSRYTGVSWNSMRQRWAATTHFSGRTRVIGFFGDEKEAAIARDRVVLRRQVNTMLNFPDLNLEPASFEQMRAWSRQIRKDETENTAVFPGVYELSGSPGRWHINLRTPNKRLLTAGSWPTPYEAAVARDRALLYYGVSKTLFNFPHLAHTLTPASVEELSAEAQRLYKKGLLSRFRGVSYNKAASLWTAAILADGRRYFLGYFKVEIDAARSYDKAAQRLHRERAKLNFHPETDEELCGMRLVPRRGSPDPHSSSKKKARRRKRSSR